MIGGARSPMMTKYAIHVPILRAIILDRERERERDRVKNLFIATLRYQNTPDLNNKFPHLSKHSQSCTDQ